MEFSQKSTVDEIRARFDRDVERFSVLETGHVATMDAALALELVTAAGAGVNPGATALLDVGCGAGNFTLKMLQRLPGLNVALIDLSRPMLERARERISAVSRNSIELIQGDVREIDFGSERFDIVVAAMVLHHLRGDDEWESVFRAICITSRRHRRLMAAPAGLCSKGSSAASSLLNGWIHTRFVALPCIQPLGTQR